MQLDDDIYISQTHRIAAYAEDTFTVRKRTINTSIIISADSLLIDWAPPDVKQITLQHLQAAIALTQEILIIGTGHSRHMLADEITCSVMSKQIGLEIMDTGAACRSYNLLLADGRQVVAALCLAGAGA